MKWYKLITLITICGIINGCAARKSGGAGTISQMQELQHKLNITALFSQDKLLYQGIPVYKKIRKDPKGQSVAFYTENGLNHGPARIMDSNGIPVVDTVYSEGRMAEYYYAKIKNRTYCLIFKDGKPWEGNLFLPGHSNTGEMEFKNGILSGVYEYENGHNRKPLIDFSKNEFRDKRPWNGFFMTEGQNKISFYRNGKIIVDQKNMELLTYINELLGQLGL